MNKGDGFIMGHLLRVRLFTEFDRLIRVDFMRVVES